LAEDRRVRFALDLPDPADREFTHTPTRGTERSAAQAEAAWEQACRQRWRALALAVKAKLEAVESGIATFEEEFAAYLVMPDGRTVWDHIQIPVRTAYEEGKVPPMLALEA
jgi:hypothetical protein